MAFIKLFQPEGGDPLPVTAIIERLKDEFRIVIADPDEGQDHVAGMIAATLRFSDSLPGKHERLALFQSLQPSAVYVSFGDDITTLASCCLMRDSALFFDSPDELHGLARSLVERAGALLGYELFEG